MKIKNTTDFSDRFIRRMISWICKTPAIDWSVRKIQLVNVRNRRTDYRRLSGHAHPWSQEITVSIGTLHTFSSNQENRIITFINLMAHEIGHLTQIIKGKYSEREVNWKANQVSKLFLEQKEDLIQSWLGTLVPVKAKINLKEQRYNNVKKNLANWEKKLKYAEKKVIKYRKKLKYYERTKREDK